VRRVLVARLDSLGDVVLSGPAIRAVAAHAEVLLLTGPRGAAIAGMLPGVTHRLVWDAPWIANPAPDVTPRHMRRLERLLDHAAVDEAVILTSFHQSPLPLALELRLCGVSRITALSEDYPGSLLDVRLTSRDLPWELHEVDRALGIAGAAGFALSEDDDGLPALVPQPRSSLRPAREYVVVHPGADAPARMWPAERAARLVDLLAAAGFRVLVTGSESERDLTASVAGDHGIDAGGMTDLRGLVDLVAGASVVVSGNTGPAHVAAAMRTPVVSLFSPVVSAGTWAPRGAPVLVLGDQSAACAGTRARVCPLPGHPCLSGVSPEEAFHAVERLVSLHPKVVA
jgi:ADP-heptose:LPS heptosyltransferase